MPKFSSYHPSLNISDFFIGAFSFEQLHLSSWRVNTPRVCNIKMLEGIYLLLSDDAVDVYQLDTSGIELMSQRAVTVWTAPGKTVDGLNNNNLHIVFRIYTVINCFLHRLTDLESWLQKLEFFDDIVATSPGILRDLPFLVFGGITVHFLLYRRDPDGRNGVYGFISQHLLKTLEGVSSGCDRIYSTISLANRSMGCTSVMPNNCGKGSGTGSSVLERHDTPRVINSMVLITRS